MGPTLNLFFHAQIKAQFKIDQAHSGYHACEASLTDAIGEVVDQKLIEFQTNKTVVKHVAGQVGSVSAAPIGQGSVLSSSVGSGVCPCYFFDFVCYLTKWDACMATLLIIIGIVAAVVLLLICSCIVCKTIGIENCCKVIHAYSSKEQKNSVCSRYCRNEALKGIMHYCHHGCTHVTAHALWGDRVRANNSVSNRYCVFFVADTVLPV